jgi:hypothetical protein
LQQEKNHQHESNSVLLLRPRETALCRCAQHTGDYIQPAKNLSTRDSKGRGLQSGLRDVANQNQISDVREKLPEPNTTKAGASKGAPAFVK